MTDEDREVETSHCNLPPLLRFVHVLLQVKALLRTVEEEVLSRSKAVESGWCFVDQQSPSEGVCVV